MNKEILMGRLTRDPEIRTAASNLNIARFSLAVDRRFKRDGEPEADFFNCTAFNKQADFVEKYCKKGTKMVVVGRIQNDNYEKDGVKHYSVQIIVDELEFAESKNASAGYQAGSTNGGSTSNTGSIPSGAEDGFMNAASGLTDELPFN